jgi:intein/homing endonuclease
MKDTKQLLSDAKFYEGYSRWDDDKQRYETWDESVDRVMNMHRSYYKNKMTNTIEGLIEEVTKAYKEKRALGAQRALQFGGDQLLRHPLKLYNCLGSYADRPEFFGEYFYSLLCGCGFGFSVQSHHILKLPNIHLRSKQPKTHVVEDSIEGWATSLDVLMSSYFVRGGRHPDFEGRKVYFDLTNIRPKGSKISGGFKAPGPEPLRAALDKIEYILQGVALKKNQKLSSVQVYDICMHTADAVISGGVRRSATICLFSPDDVEMANAKTGNWFIDNPQRARSNNSALIVRKNITRERFHELMQTIKQFGEPGFYFAESTEHATNPCLSGDTWVTTKDGPKQISTIIEEYKNTEDKTIEILVDGVFRKTTSRGFWETSSDSKLYELTLFNGMKIKATENHQFLSKDDWVELKDLAIGDEVFLSENNSNIAWEGSGGSKEQGWLIGNLIGDGTFNSDDSCKWSFWGDSKTEMQKKCSILLEELKVSNIVSQNYGNETHKDFLNVSSTKFVPTLKEWGVKRGDKHINPIIETGSTDFYKGIIGGFFDADGCVTGSNKTGLSAVFTQIYKESLEILQRMLSRVGIQSKIRKSRASGFTLLPDGLGGKKLYPTQDCYELRITGRETVSKLFSFMYSLHPEKKEKYVKLISEYKKNPYNNDNNTSQIVKIEYMGNGPVYDCTVPETSAFDANGIYVHNCVEISFFPQLEGVTGIQGCNLTEINGSLCVDEDSFYLACRIATILGTLQAGYTNFDFVSETTKKIFEREALLGVSITGWMNNPDILFNETILKKGAKICKEVNAEVAKLLGINAAARITCTKPSGNACLGFDSRIKTELGDMTLEEIFNFISNNQFDLNTAYENQTLFSEKSLKVYDENNELQTIKGGFVNGYDDSYEVEFEDGGVFMFTGKHKLKTTKGWKMVSDLLESDVVISY